MRKIERVSRFLGQIAERMSERDQDLPVFHGIAEQMSETVECKKNYVISMLL